MSFTTISHSNLIWFTLLNGTGQPINLIEQFSTTIVSDYPILQCGARANWQLNPPPPPLIIACSSNYLAIQIYNEYWKVTKHPIYVYEQKSMTSKVMQGNKKIDFVVSLVLFCVLSAWPHCKLCIKFRQGADAKKSNMAKKKRSSWPFLYWIYICKLCCVGWVRPYAGWSQIGAQSLNIYSKLWFSHNLVWSSSLRTKCPLVATHSVQWPFYNIV